MVSTSYAPFQQILISARTHVGNLSHRLQYTYSVVVGCPYLQASKQSVTETVREQALSVTILQNQQQASLALAEATAENEKFKKYVLELEESLSTMEMKYEFERFQMISDHRDEMLKLTESYKSEFKSLEEKCKSCTICLEQVKKSLFSKKQHK